MRVAWPLALAALWPVPGLAHGMGASVGYRQTLESMLESVSSPVVLLLIAGFGLLAGTSGIVRTRVAVGFLGVGLVVGILASGLLGPYGAIAGLVVAAVCGLWSAASKDGAPVEVLAVLGLAGGLAASIYNLDGHVAAELPFAVHLGVVLGPLILFVAVPGWIAIILQSTAQAWVRILFRIFSSWCFAACAIYVAFTLKSGG